LLFVINDMKRLIQKSKRKIDHLSAKEHRALYDLIEWDERLILLLGHRGTGKTTLLLQHLKNNATSGIYLSLDDSFLKTTD